MAAERKPTTVRLSDDEKRVLQMQFGSVQGAVDDSLGRATLDLPEWTPRLPRRLAVPYERLREMALPVPDRIIPYGMAILTLQVECDLTRNQARRYLEALYKFNVVYYVLRMYYPDGDVFVACTEGEQERIRTREFASETRRSADEVKEDEGTDGGEPLCDEVGEGTRKVVGTSDKAQNSICIASPGF